MIPSRIPRPPVGWPLLPQPDEAGALHYPTLERSVRDQIRIILSTRPGEQLMRPEFGAGLEEFLHEPNTLETRRRIRDRIQESLQAFEPRILLDAIEVSEVEGETSHILAEIFYLLVRTVLAHRLGLTVQVER